MRARLFWRLGLTYVALLVAVLIVVYLYSSQAIRSQAIRSANSELTSLLNVAQSRPPNTSDPADLRGWTEWMAKSGARVSIIDASGNVLADSAGDAARMENHADRPEVQQAIAEGRGEAVHRSATLDRELVYQAVRYQEPGGQSIIIRLAVPLSEIDSSARELRRRLFVASALMLLIGAIVSLAFTRRFAARIERLKDLSQRIAEGNFRPVPREGPRDELSELADSLNQTAARLDLQIQMLSGERNRSSAILRSMVEGVAVIDAQERLVFYNRAFSEIFGVDNSVAEGKTLIEVVRNAELVGLIRKVLRGGEGLQSDIAMGIATVQNFSVTAAPVKALEPTNGGQEPANAKPSGAVVVLHDVTELRRLERVRQDFVANVSHEFKTPLTAIQGFAETLLGGALDDPSSNRRFLDIIRNHAMRLARLTNDLLKLARIEAGKLEVEFFPVGLMELIEGCAETTLMKASRKQITLEIEVAPGLPAVRGDAGLLRDVLQNLLDNAVQYTPEGGHIHVTAEARNREAVITVSDTGIGIPAPEKERIFERFYRVDAARSREAGGTGLGLSIAKHIVEAHSGRLWVESVIGEGSKFSFSVPIAS